MTQTYDILIIGGGIVGLTTARSLLMRQKLSIAILEKETQLGMHASGRNSGVLHAGFYYSSESLKARLCARGSRLLSEYAYENNIPVVKTGKVVVATCPENVAQMQVLLKRAKDNNIILEKIDLQQLRELEPEAHSFDSALHSPSTAVIDSKMVLKKISDELVSSGVQIFKGQEVVSIEKDNRLVMTKDSIFEYGHLVNTAGLHADYIAHQMDVGENYCILPFKGIYRKLSSEASKRFRGSLYPVPDLRVPFLGVHITRNVHNEVYIGPTAIPAFGRENYDMFSGIEFVEGIKIAYQLGKMISKDTQGMRASVAEELGRYSNGGFLKAAQAIAPKITAQDILDIGKVGLRAQLFDKKKAQLEMDFVIEKGLHSTHILNAISPAFSASMAFSEMIADKVLS